MFGLVAEQGWMQLFQNDFQSETMAIPLQEMFLPPYCDPNRNTLEGLSSKENKREMT